MRHETIRPQWGIYRTIAEMHCLISPYGLVAKGDPQRGRKNRNSGIIFIFSLAELKC